MKEGDKWKARSFSHTGRPVWGWMQADPFVDEVPCQPLWHDFSRNKGLCFACGLFCRQVKKLLTTLSKCSIRVRPFRSRCIQSSNLWSSCRGKAGKYWNMAARALFLPSRTTHALSPAGTVCLLAEQHLGVCFIVKKTLWKGTQERS